MAEQNGNGNTAKRFDLYRYFARSFVLPLLALVAIAVLAYTYPEKWDQLWKPGLLMLGAIGSFNLDQISKDYIRTRWGKEGGANP